MQERKIIELIQEKFPQNSQKFGALSCMHNDYHEHKKHSNEDYMNTMTMLSFIDIFMEGIGLCR